jgi:hypothetical protein
MRRLSHLVVGLVTGALGAVVPGGAASGAPACEYAERHVFAIAADGRLHELRRFRPRRCAGAPVVEHLGVVDGGNWRAYRWVTAAVDGPVTTIWTVGADGRLVRRVQAAPGAALGPAEVVETGRDWAPVNGILATPHALLMDYDGPRAPKPPPGTAQPSLGRSTRALPSPSPWHRTVRVFTPTDAGLVEVEPLFTRALGSTLTSVSDGFGEAIDGYVHRRVFRVPEGQAGDNPALRSGTLPTQLHGFTGDEDFLGGLSADGRIVVLRQDWRQRVPPYHDPMLCPFNPAPFTPYATTTSTGWIRLVVPGRADPGAIRATSAHGSGDCPNSDDPRSWPWDWQ